MMSKAHSIVEGQARALKEISGENTFLLDEQRRANTFGHGPPPPIALSVLTRTRALMCGHALAAPPKAGVSRVARCPDGNCFAAGSRLPWFALALAERKECSKGENKRLRVVFIMFPLTAR